jgi:hypothetical protein
MGEDFTGIKVDGAESKRRSCGSKRDERYDSTGLLTDK